MCRPARYAEGYAQALSLLNRLLGTYAIIIIAPTINDALNALNVYYEGLEVSKTFPITSIVQVPKVVAFAIVGTVAASFLFDIPAVYVLAAIGALAFRRHGESAGIAPLNRTATRAGVLECLKSTAVARTARACRLRRGGFALRLPHYARSRSRSGPRLAVRRTNVRRRLPLPSYRPWRAYERD